MSHKVVVGMEGIQIVPNKNFSTGSESTALYVGELCHESRQLFDSAILISKTISHSSNALKYQNKCLG